MNYVGRHCTCGCHRETTSTNPDGCHYCQRNHSAEGSVSNPPGNYEHPDSIRAKFDALQAERDALLVENTRLKDDKDVMTGQLQGAREAYRCALGDVKKLGRDWNTARDAHDRRQAECDALKAERDGARNALARMMEEVERVKVRNSELLDRLGWRSEEVRRLRGQLPATMPDCTIRFVECPAGHGRLTATNWVDTGCQTCEAKRLREALEPFSHKDLCAILGGNVQGDDSPVFWRNKAILKLGDFRRARSILYPASEWAASWGAGSQST
jgi:hypothetical protein